MFGFHVILLLSTTVIQQTNGVRKTENRILIKPPFQGREEKYNYFYKPYVNDRIVVSWEDRGDNKEGSYNDEEIKFIGYQKDDEEKGSRRLFEWFSRLFQSTTPRDIETTITTTESNYQKELKERIFLRALHRNLTELLFKLSDVEKRVSIAMEQMEAYAILTKGKPRVFGLDNAFYYRERLKRDVSDVIKVESITKNTVTEKSTNYENKSTAVIKLNTTECPCENNITSGRRAGSILATPTDVKNKLLLYLQESFQEIKGKIMSLKDLKQAFSDNISFKIGYILANIDTLEVTMFNLKNNMDKNKELWEDNKILELYDTLKVSNQAVSGLIESLKVYLEKLSYQPQSKPEISLG